MQKVVIRSAVEADIDALTRLLNTVVDERDKTAIDTHLSNQEFAEWFVTGPHALTCVLAEDGTGQPLGFQILERFHSDLDASSADIGTYVAEHARARGVGRMLAGLTKQLAYREGLTSIRAVIRRKNSAAIRFYRSIGFSREVASLSPDTVHLTHETHAASGSETDSTSASG